MRIGVVQFPGSNCERETRLALLRAEMEPVDFLWNEPVQKLADMQGFIIVGGFSWEDRLRAGAIAARHPVMAALKQQSALGKPILGICNGAQILLESGLVPGPYQISPTISPLEGGPKGGIHVPKVALTNNKRIKNGQVLGVDYYNDWVHIKPNTHAIKNAFNRHCSTILRLPVAHAEGRFIANWDDIATLEKGGQIAWQYCDETFAVIDEFPINPNGSVYNIAALTNAHGNVMAMMPHPERTSLCDGIFQSMCDYIKDGLVPIAVTQPTELAATMMPSDLSSYQRELGSHSIVIELIIADNHALTLQSVLKHSGVEARVNRREYWEISLQDNDELTKIFATGVLFNEKKSKLIKETKPSSSKQFLVMPKDDLIAQKKMEQLRRHFGIQGLNNIRHGILWEITGTQSDVDTIFATGLLCNPTGSDCYEYR